MPYPDRFYPVVDSLDWVERLTKLGVGTIQLRAKDLDDSQALQVVTDALAITNGTQAKLVVNDYSARGDRRGRKIPRISARRIWRTPTSMPSARPACRSASPRTTTPSLKPRSPQSPITSRSARSSSPR